MIRVACIGLGEKAGPHLRYLATRPDVRIEALCDSDPAALRACRRPAGARAFTSVARMLRAVPLDAVWICTPASVRRGPLLACAARRLPVMCEIPVERTLARAWQLARDLKARDARVQVGYVFRSVPIVRRLLKEMRGDDIRGIVSVFGCGQEAGAGGRARPEALLEQIAHNVDLLRLLVGDAVRVDRAGAGARSADGAQAAGLQFATGAAGSHIHLPRGSTWRNEMLLTGARRSYRLDLGRGLLTIEEGSKVRAYRQDPSRLYEHEDARFLDQVVAGEWDRNPCDFEQGVASLALALACKHAPRAAAGRTSGTRKAPCSR